MMWEVTVTFTENPPDPAVQRIAVASCEETDKTAGASVVSYDSESEQHIFKFTIDAVSDMWAQWQALAKASASVYGGER